MTIVKWPLLSFGARGRIANTVDDADFNFDDGIFAGLEDLANLLFETGGKIELEWGFKWVYRNKPGPNGRVCVKQPYVISYNPRLPDQQFNRMLFAAAIDAWQDLTFEEEIYWNKLKYPAHMSGYNRFIRNYMLTN